MTTSRTSQSEERRTSLSARHGDARKTHVPHRGDLRAGGLQSGGGMVQADGRSELLLGGQGVRLAVRYPEVTVRQESRAGAGRQRRAGDQQRVTRVHCEQLHPEDDGQWASIISARNGMDGTAITHELKCIILI